MATKTDKKAVVTELQSFLDTYKDKQFSCVRIGSVISATLERNDETEWKPSQAISKTGQRIATGKRQQDGDGILAFQQEWLTSLPEDVTGMYLERGKDDFSCWAKIPYVPPEPKPAKAIPNEPVRVERREQPKEQKERKGTVQFKKTGLIRLPTAKRERKRYDWTGFKEVWEKCGGDLHKVAEHFGCSYAGARRIALKDGLLKV